MVESHIASLLMYSFLFRGRDGCDFVRNRLVSCLFEGRYTLNSTSQRQGTNKRPCVSLATGPMAAQPYDDGTFQQCNPLLVHSHNHPRRASSSPSNYCFLRLLCRLTRLDCGPACVQTRDKLTTDTILQERPLTRNELVMLTPSDIG